MSCQDTLIKDKSPLSGLINEGDEKSLIIEKLADSYLEGNFGIAKDYFDPDGKHFFNNFVSQDRALHEVFACFFVK